MIVLICGDRNWTDFKTIDNFLVTQSPVTTKIVEGDSKGADKISGYLARKRGFEVIAEPAKFDRFGLFAGPIRNGAMIHIYEPDLVVAFHNDVEHSKGTKNMLYQATKCGIKTMIIKSGENYVIGGFK